MKIRTHLAVSLGLLMISLVISCKTSNSTYEIKILQNQQLVKSYSMDVINKMSFKSFVKDGTIESGPSLAYLLNDAGITTYSIVTLKNQIGEIFNIDHTQNTEDYILDITNHGTVKLASEKLPKNKWFKDITEISVDNS